jgi:hypothetical protein
MNDNGSPTTDRRQRVADNGLPTTGCLQRVADNGSSGYFTSTAALIHNAFGLAE